MAELLDDDVQARRGRDRPPPARPSQRPTRRRSGRRGTRRGPPTTPSRGYSPAKRNVQGHEGAEQRRRARRRAPIGDDRRAATGAAPSVGSSARHRRRPRRPVDVGGRAPAATPAEADQREADDDAERGEGQADPHRPLRLSSRRRRRSPVPAASRVDEPAVAVAVDQPGRARGRAVGAGAPSRRSRTGPRRARRARSRSAESSRGSTAERGVDGDRSGRSWPRRRASVARQRSPPRSDGRTQPVDVDAEVRPTPVRSTCSPASRSTCHRPSGRTASTARAACGAQGVGGRAGHPDRRRARRRSTRRSSRHPLSNVSAAGGDCTPGMPSSAMPIGHRDR